MNTNDFKSSWKKLSINDLAKQLDTEKLPFLFDFIMQSGNKYRTYIRRAVESFSLLDDNLAQEAHTFLAEHVTIVKSLDCHLCYFVALTRLGRKLGFSQSASDFCHQQLQMPTDKSIDYVMYLYMQGNTDCVWHLSNDKPRWQNLLAWSNELLELTDISAEVLQYFAKHGLGNFDGGGELPHDAIVHLLLQKFNYAPHCQTQIVAWWNEECAEFKEDDYFDADTIAEAFQFVRLLKANAHPMLAGFEQCFDWFIMNEIEMEGDIIRNKLTELKMPIDDLSSGFKQALLQQPSAFIVTGNWNDYDENKPEQWYEPTQILFKLADVIKQYSSLYK